MVSIAVSAPAAVPKPAGWRTTLAAMLLLVAASTTMIGLIQGVLWWMSLIATGVVLLGAGAVLRRVGVSRWLVPFIGAALLLVILTLVFGAGTAIAGVIPTPATFSRFGELFALSGDAIARQSTPAQPLPELLFLIVLCGGVLTLLIDVCASALRMPALTAVPIAVVLLAPMLLLPQGVSPLALVACAVGYLIVLRADARGRVARGPQAAFAVSVGACAIVIALLISTTAPGFQQIGRQSIAASGVSIGTGINPLIDLGQDLRRPNAIEVLRYATTSSTPPYLRLTTLDQFTGTTWRHQRSPGTDIHSGGELGAPGDLGDGVKTEKIDTLISVENMSSSWLPAPYPATKVTGLAGEWMWERNDRTLTSIEGGTMGQDYQVTSLDVHPTAEQLRVAPGGYDRDVQRDLFVPFNAPASIAQTAREVTADATTAYDKAVALQNYFHNGEFSYSTDTPAKKGFDGDSMDVIATFLKVKEGYCVHFASAMAVMARTLDIPARIAMGYLPGSPSGSDDKNRRLYTVSSDDLHAWPELYFAGVGWVPFEPTVGRGSVPDYSEPGFVAPAPLSPAAEQAQSTPNALVPTDDPTQTTTSSADTSTAGAPGITAAAGILVVVVILLIPALVRRSRRTARLKRLADDWGSAKVAWAEVRDTARDLGFRTSRTETIRGFADRLSSSWARGDPARDALARVVTAAEREEYGPPGFARYDPAVREAVREVLGAMSARAGAVARMRALLVPVSLVPEAAPWLKGRLTSGA
jgi:transglutaminase-like putative cysteine protease